jgi:SIR2-like protein
VRTNQSGPEDRDIALGSGLLPIPERLLLAHANGEVLFLCGAGISQPAGLPDFRQLVLDVYSALDTGVHAVISALPPRACNHWEIEKSDLRNDQIAEVRRFILGDYDVVLGMLERRLDIRSSSESPVRTSESPVRTEVAKQLRAGKPKPAQIHRALVRLADRGGAMTIVTTNFDLLLESAAKSMHSPEQTYSLGSMPRPSPREEFAGVLHIHGALDAKPARSSELVLSDHDFGEFYLRRRVVPDFIYDAARIFHLVLVGYSANDPPMRYLLNSVASEETRFEDVKERFTFIGAPKSDPVVLEDWKARGITPIPYSAPDGDHSILSETLQRWAKLSAINGKKKFIDAEIRRIVKLGRFEALEQERDLFDHLIRRDRVDRERLSALASSAGADLGWLEAIVRIGAEREWRHTS